MWAGPAFVPGAIAAALLVFGGYLLSLRAGLFVGDGIGRRGGIRHFDGHPEPVLITDLDGRAHRCKSPLPCAPGVGERARFQGRDATG